MARIALKAGATLVAMTVLILLIALGRPSAVPPPPFPAEPPAAVPADTALPTQTLEGADAREERPEWGRPRFAQRRAERERMVRTQIVRRDVTDPAVVEAMRNVPRHLFVPAGVRDDAYGDYPLPIGHGQTISQPYIVAFMTQLLDLKPGDRVLEIGTGSAYQAAVLSEITPHVFTIEIVKPLAEAAAARLDSLGYKTVRVKQGDGYYGWPEHGPFDAIIVTAAAGHVPPPLTEQLKPGGRMVIPLGGVYDVQQLVLITKDREGTARARSLLPVRFVPMTGAVQTGGALRE